MRERQAFFKTGFKNLSYRFIKRRFLIKGENKNECIYVLSVIKKKKV